MVELLVRFVVSVVAVATSWQTGAPPYETAVRAALVFFCYSFFAFLLERRGMRNSGVAGLIAAADAAMIAFYMSEAKTLEHFGFLTLAPMVWAAGRFEASATSVAPLVAAWILVGANLPQGPGWTPMLLGQAVGVLAIGLIVRDKPRVVTVRETVVAETGEEPEGPPMPDGSAIEDVELRESFKSLRDHARQLERRSRRDRFGLHLLSAAEAAAINPYETVAHILREHFEASGLTLFVRQPFGSTLVAMATAGDAPAHVRDASLELPRQGTELQARDRMLATLGGDPDRANSPLALVLLHHQGRVVGAIAASDKNPTRLGLVHDQAREIADVLASTLATVAHREQVRRRAREAELLYEISCVTTGAETTLTLASRVVREVSEILDVDHVSLHLVEDGQDMVAASFGPRVETMEALSFAKGPGLAGWLGIGAPELALLDARIDARLPREESLRRRIGSLVVLPLEFGDAPFGYLAAMTHRQNGLSVDDLETLRIVAAETSQAVARLERKGVGPEGLATPSEFHTAVQEADRGYLVYLEVPRREQLVEAHGRTAVDFAVRKFASRLRASLPADGLMCRRPEGDYVAFLRSGDEAKARDWANGAVATASMVALTTPDGRARVPLALKAKVARYAPQADRLSTSDHA
ncbi:MAG: GAF domain-containing protein [Fimbriimonadaceae bacterium]|nr:GAF domain-containing protein [Fimbriimonadaceae bacterium]QYK56299.1 MAG: GAF domain-containing protein [Fimbriimonadaceae bacterium]